MLDNRERQRGADAEEDEEGPFPVRGISSVL